MHRLKESSVYSSKIQKIYKSPLNWPKFLPVLLKMQTTLELQQIPQDIYTFEILLDHLRALFLLNPNSFMEYAKLMKIKAIAMISLWLFEAASQTQK